MEDMYLSVISTDSDKVSSSEPGDQWVRVTSSHTLHYNELV